MLFSISSTLEDAMNEQTPQESPERKDDLPEVMPQRFKRPEQTNRAKITRVDKLYYQPPNEEAVLFDTSLSQFLESDEQPFLRKKTATSEWSPIETGWINPENCGLLTIDNRSEEKVNIEIGIEFSTISPTLPFCYLVPGARFTIALCGAFSLRSLRIRALDIFPCKYTLCLFPK